MEKSLDKSKYEFLLSLKSLDFQIKELGKMSEQDTYCYEILRNKIDELSMYVINPRNQKLWQKWGGDQEIREQIKLIRESAVKAICNLEKYESKEVITGGYESSSYFSSLSEQLEEEIDTYCMNNQSYILFIGSGALPLSALTIAKNTGAKMMCIDIDEETIPLAKQATAKLGLAAQASFSNNRVSQLIDGDQFTHVIIASLVYDKDRLINELIHCIHPEAQVIVRYGDGLKSLFNYPSDEFASPLWKLVKHENKGFFYDTALIQWTSKEVAGGIR